MKCYTIDSRNSEIGTKHPKSETHLTRFFIVAIGAFPSFLRKFLCLTKTFNDKKTVS